MLKNRAGFTLAEVMIALTLTAIIGAAVTGVFVSQSRFFDHQEKVGAAREVSRGAMNIMMSEMRMIEQDSGIVAATNRRLTLRVPFAFGIACDVSVTDGLTLSMLPVDNAVLADSGFSGYAYRSLSGDYTYISGLSFPQSGDATRCDVAGLVPGSNGVVPTAASGAMTQGSVIRIPLATDPSTAGTPVFLYQLITYEFKPSAMVPGSRTALWRRIHATNVDEELVAPFDTTAKFRFYVNDSPAAQTMVPADLSTVTGIEIVLDAVSERPDGDGSHQTVPLTTSVFFKNR